MVSPDTSSTQSPICLAVAVVPAALAPVLNCHPVMMLSSVLLRPLFAARMQDMSEDVTPLWLVEPLK